MTNDEILQAAHHLIGTPYTPAVKAVVEALTGRSRIVGAGEISTREFDPERIHIIANQAGIIEGFRFN